MDCKWFVSQSYSSLGSDNLKQTDCYNSKWVLGKSAGWTDCTVSYLGKPHGSTELAVFLHLIRHQNIRLQFILLQETKITLLLIPSERIQSEILIRKMGVYKWHLLIHWSSSLCICTGMNQSRPSSSLVQNPISRSWLQIDKLSP